MQRLQMFTAYELKLLVCGEQTPSWTREDIVNFTEPKFGYTKDRSVLSLFHFAIITEASCVLFQHSIITPLTLALRVDTQSSSKAAYVD